MSAEEDWSLDDTRCKQGLGAAMKKMIVKNGIVYVKEPHKLLAESAVWKRVPQGLQKSDRLLNELSVSHEQGT